VLKNSLTLIYGHFFSSYEDLWGEKLAPIHISSIVRGINEKRNTFNESVNNLKIKHTIWKIQFKTPLKATLI